MKILLVGSGGREHALAWKLAQSPLCETLYCAPGNAGITQCAQCVDIGAEDISGLTNFAVENEIDLVVVGPEGPLVLGLADALQNHNIPVFGPSADAAQLEGSKGFTKDLCAEFDIPTAAYGRFSNVAEAENFIRQHGAPIVIKADGLAAGKGVIIATSEHEAIEAAKDMLSGECFGDAGAEIVIEEFLDGEELSYFALADGKTILPLSSAQDHKRAYDGDKGPNTGGMGAYSPAHLMNDDLEQKILNRIIKPTVEGMQKRGMPFTGVLYAGLMIVGGEPFLIEYNTRFGDPECQALMMRLNGDLVKILDAAAKGNLEDIRADVRWDDNHALCLVLAAKGYPGSYQKNTPINGINDADAMDDVTVFHAGTAQSAEQGQFLSVGGRVLGVTALGDTIEQARTKAYDAAAKIDWPDGFYRKDIGWRAVEKSKDVDAA